MAGILGAPSCAFKMLARGVWSLFPPALRGPPPLPTQGYHIPDPLLTVQSLQSHALAPSTFRSKGNTVLLWVNGGLKGWTESSTALLIAGEKAGKDPQLLAPGLCEIWSGRKMMATLRPSQGPLASSEGGNPAKEETLVQRVPLRRKIQAIKRLDPKFQRDVLSQGLGRPRCQQAQRLLKRGDPKSVSARCPLFLHQLKPRLHLWAKALTAQALPPPLYPEVAFAGRSNAGKSTLINELCGRSGTAGVSKRPGSTQELFFFKAGSPCSLCLVDLPGYGYAEAEPSKRLQWTEMSLFYLKTRPNLKRVFLLVDARWGLRESDLCLLAFFERHRIPFQLVLTKADLPEQKFLIKVLQIVGEEQRRFKGCAGPPLAVSALRHRGLDPLRAEIDKLRLSKEAANLVEAQRLKKELRTRAKAKGSSSAGGPLETSASQAREAQAAAPESAAHADDPVARALWRWGAHLPEGFGKVLTGKQPQIPRDLIDAASSDNPMPGPSCSEMLEEGAVRNALNSAHHRRHAVCVVDDVQNIVSQDLETHNPDKHVPEASAVVAALDRAAGALPLPDVSYAKALIKNFPPPGLGLTLQTDTQVDKQPRSGRNATADVVLQHSEDSRARAASKGTAISPRGDVCNSHSLAGPYDGSSSKEFGMASSGATDVLEGDKTQLSCGAVCVNKTALPLIQGEVGPALPMVAVQRCAGKENDLALEETRDVTADEMVSLGSRGKFSSRPLDALRAKEWRARRVSKSAVEIDMRLPGSETASSRTFVHLETGCKVLDESMLPPGQVQGPKSAPTAGAACSFPDLSAVFAFRRQPNIRCRKDTTIRRPPPFATTGADVILDEETLAAEALMKNHTGNGGRVEGAPDACAHTGLYELDMQRSFERKWCKELLPIGHSEDLRDRKNIEPQQQNASRAASWNTRKGSLNPFRIPADYIMTREDCNKPLATRMAFEVRLQRAQEEPRPSESPPVSEGRDLSSADSLLFSAAQRRQEHRLRALTTKTGRRDARSKEMTWDVAYRKWVRWAKAHPHLARSVPRPSKARLYADFRWVSMHEAETFIDPYWSFCRKLQLAFK
ncbi:GTP-binding conserved hypothetical domain-containing protein [Cyclospora cayetanensis]|uniref:GTP-binding conserved hypothetical domain-containing protein n=1 Tax=Cyclospora cayetanensis TaxID=88456 RepID=A0A1D3D8G6_9EIME|nr:GTP-binding conserved hypothetical domain-containing protein [Cyclospora cayetanensis]